MELSMTKKTEFNIDLITDYISDEVMDQINEAEGSGSLYHFRSDTEGILKQIEEMMNDSGQDEVFIVKIGRRN